MYWCPLLSALSWVRETCGETDRANATECSWGRLLESYADTRRVFRHQVYRNKVAGNKCLSDAFHMAVSFFFKTQITGEHYKLERTESSGQKRKKAFIRRHSLKWGQDRGTVFRELNSIFSSPGLLPEDEPWSSPRLGPPPTLSTLSFWNPAHVTCHTVVHVVVPQIGLRV